MPENEILCPYCNKPMQIVITDNDGALRDEEYAKNPNNGIAYAITHPREDSPDCIIATEMKESYYGEYLYDTPEEARRALKINANWIATEEMKYLLNYATTADLSQSENIRTLYVCLVIIV